ncbi:hypothetical protein [Desulfitobacterium hafniense]|uniref:hypothetical protein n=1 Tax=Desulfitobacterium hafniense TaxID=49338 RepID=UPI0003129908|nr:hypothetical protein [Desulfitobacterium hafniense]
MVTTHLILAITENLVNPVTTEIPAITIQAPGITGEETAFLLLPIANPDEAIRN